MAVSSVMVPLGTSVPDFALPDLDGQEIVIAVENLYTPFQFEEPLTGETMGYEGVHKVTSDYVQPVIQSMVLSIPLLANLNGDRGSAAMAGGNPLTRSIGTILFHRAFPVDIRHNSKIFRESWPCGPRGKYEPVEHPDSSGNQGTACVGVRLGRQEDLCPGAGIYR